MSKMLSKMNLISVVQQLPKEDIETIQGYVEMIEEENKQLKKQLENCYCNRTDCAGRIKDSKVYDSLVQAQEAQQKEFIKYLEDEIKKEKEDLEHLCDLYKIPQKNNSTYKFVYSYINKIEKILQKYKEITQTKSDKSV